MKEVEPGANLVEDLTVDAYRASDGSGAEQLRRNIERWRPTSNARDQAVAGGAHLVLYKLEQEVADLEAAVEYLSCAHETEPSAVRAANLASALLERSSLLGPSRAERVRAIDSAIGLLEVSLRQSDVDTAQWTTRAITLTGARADRFEITRNDADLEAAIETGEALVASAGTTGLGAGEPESLMASILLAAADIGHPAGELDRAVSLLRHSIAALPDGHLDLPGRLSNLGAVLADRHERTGRQEDLDEALRLQRRAFRAFHASDGRLGRAANNLLNVLVTAAELEDSSDLAAEALTLSSRLLAAFPAPHPLRPLALANVALAEQASAERLRRPALLDAAIAHLEESVVETLPNDTAIGLRRTSLAVSLAARYRLSGDPSDLQEAIRTAELVASSPNQLIHETAGFASNYGNLLHERYLLTGQIADLDRAVDEHVRGLRTLPVGHRQAPQLLNNASIAFGARFDRLSNPADLARAIEAGRDAVAASAGALHLQATQQANLAATLARAFEFDGSTATLVEAEALAVEAYATLRAGSDGPTTAASWAILVDLSRARWENDADETARKRLDELLAAVPGGQHADPTLVPGQLLRIAVVSHSVGLQIDRNSVLLEAARTGLIHRPSVALSAARQLAVDALARRVKGDRQATSAAAEAERLGKAAVDRLTGSNASARYELAWRREAQGVSAAVAHVHSLDGDAPAALSAYSAGHGTLLQRQLNLPEVTDQSPIDSYVVTLWTTPVGGGAIVTSGGTQKIVDLPDLDQPFVVRMVRRLGIAARIGGRSIEGALAQAIPRLTLALAPLVAELPAAGQPITWCAGGLAGLLPIAAVPANEVPLGLTHPISQSPTPGISAWARALSAERELDLNTASAFAAPQSSVHSPLAGAEAEAAVFAQPNRRYLGPDATSAAFLAAAPSSSLLHFAGHAFTSATDPLSNHLLLAGDEPLYAEAIGDLNLSSRLVVLSACDTAAIGNEHADEALGLATAFHLAGAPGVIASLWPVTDRATATFMGHFGDALRNGHPPAQALTRARASHCSEGGRVSTWAAFVLLGA